MKEEIKKNYLLFVLDSKTYKPNMESIASFPNYAEAYKAKEFLKKSNMFALILTIDMLDTKEQFCKIWQDKLKCSMLEELGYKSH